MKVGEIMTCHLDSKSFFLTFIEILLIYNVLLVASVQQSDLSIYTVLDSFPL